MALNVQVFRTRALTAVLFVLVMLAGLLISSWTFLCLFTLIHFGCWKEYQKMVAGFYPSYSRISPFHRFAVMFTGWGFMLWTGRGFFGNAVSWIHPVALAMMTLLPAAILATELFSFRNFTLKNLGLSLLGLLYISLSWGLMVQLRSLNSEGLFGDQGWVIPMVVVASIWINDTMAYLVGSLIGKTPFSKISPKKTWEGTLGGAILAIAVVTGAGYYLFGMKDYGSLLAISSIAAVTGTAGDLLESKLKRMAGMKDSGTILPGHGGFLDRFDSLLLATPFVWIYVSVFLH